MLDIDLILEDDNNFLTKKPQGGTMESNNVSRVVYLWVMLLFIIMLPVNSVYAQYAGGQGTPHSPYIIETPEHLNNVRLNTGAIFRQNVDIDMSPELLQNEDWYDINRGWLPIPTFSGIYDGAGFTISNLTMYRPFTSQPGGLFGNGDNAVLRNIGLINPQITGYNFLGAIMGRPIGGNIYRCYSEGGYVKSSQQGGSAVGERVGGLFGQPQMVDINQCYSTTDVYGTRYVGGLIGFGGTIDLSDCYATGRVFGSSYIGGFIGYDVLAANYDNSYSTGKVTAEATQSGGFAGTLTQGIYTNTYWNTETSGWDTPGGSGGAINPNYGLTTVQMTQQNSFVGFDFEDVWAIDEETGIPYLQYQEEASIYNSPGPYNLIAEGGNSEVNLSWEEPFTGVPAVYRIYRNGEFVGDVDHPARTFLDEEIEPYQLKQYYVSFVDNDDNYWGVSNRAEIIAGSFAAGDGSEESPYEIDNAHQLHSLRYYMSDYFIQTEDIDLGVFDNWYPIGCFTHNSYKGSLDGNGHQIINLNINNPFDYNGLFAFTDGAHLTNVNLNDISIRGVGNNCGGLVGSAREGTRIEKSSVIGTIESGGNAVGGLVGWSNSASIVDSYFEGEIVGNSQVGGIVGSSTETGDIISEIVRCYSHCDIDGNFDIGGIAGIITNGTVSNSYSTAIVDGNDRVGGLIGDLRDQVRHSYSTGGVSGTGANVGGLIGSTSGGFNVVNSYWNIETSGQENSAAGNGRSNDEMISRDTYQGWDFDDTWDITLGLTYPYLRWQQEPGSHNSPVRPRNLAAEVGNQLVALSWNHPIAGEPEGYNLYRDDEIITSVNYPANSYNDTEVQNFITYRYYVTAIIDEDTESDRSNTVSVIPFHYDGEGTPEEPYEVVSAGHLDYIRNLLDAHFIQTADFDLDVEPWNEGAGFPPIGGRDAGERFTGSYNGDGYVIDNLMIDRSDVLYLGLFAFGDGAEFKNMNVINASVRSGGTSGIIVAEAENSSFTNCHVSGAVSGTITVGGLSARISQTEVDGCSSTARLTGNRGQGGIAGSVQNNSTIRNSYFAGQLYNLQSMSGSGNGGIAGTLNEGCTISNCYSVGYNNTVTYGDDEFIGGIVGSNSGEVVNSYWNFESSTIVEADGGARLNTVEMMQRDSFEDWDFDEVWTIQQNESYPWLQWMEEPSSHNYPNLIPPVNLRGMPGNNQATVLWDSPSYGEPDGYKIFRNEVYQATVDGDENEFRQEDLENHRNYYYRVIAVYDEIDSQPSKMIRVYPFQGFAGGSGTEDDPYQIATAEQLDNIRLSNFRRYNFIQTANIDLAQFENWDPIARSDIDFRFTGTYDGDGYIISNLTIDRDQEFVGLFGYLDTVAIRNLNLADVIIRGENYTSSLGYVRDSDVINVSVTGEISGDRYVGGIASYAIGASNIEGCYVDIILEATGRDVGGMVGYTTGTTTIKNCYSLGDYTTESSYIGGIAGYILSNSEIIACYSIANIVSEVDYAGGIAGYSSRPISNSYALGAVSGTRYVGGLIGRQVGSSVENCYSVGRVSSENDLDIGGMIGNNTGEITNSYWDIELSGREDSAGGEGRSTEQMTYEYDWGSTYLNWDFDEMWVADETFTEGVNPGLNRGYPLLYWQEMILLNQPQVNISIDVNDQPVLSWQAVDNANSYRVYSSNDPYQPFSGWEMIGNTAEVYFIDEAEIENHKFYRVVASIDDPGRGRLGQIPDKQYRQLRRGSTNYRAR